MSTHKHLSALSLQYQFCHVSIGLKMQPCFWFYPCSPLLLWFLLINPLVIFQAFVHHNKTHFLHSNIILSNSMAKLPVSPIGIPLLADLHSFIIVSCLLVLPHQSPPPLLMSQLLIGIKTLVSSTSVMPWRHWAGFDHEEDVISKWRGKDGSGLDSLLLDLVFVLIFMFLSLSLLFSLLIPILYIF